MRVDFIQNVFFFSIFHALDIFSYSKLDETGKRRYFMDYRLPYYMAYPMPLQYDDERIERYDFEYMKSMYPQTAKKVLALCRG